MNKIYVFGHKKPDTDSVTSAIALAYLKRKLGFDAEAKVLGRLNNETKYALNYFNVKYPEYLNDVKPQIKDINFNRTLIEKTDSIRNCYDKLRENKLSGAPVVDDRGKLFGVITLNDISNYLIDGDFSKLNTSYDNLMEVLDGEEILRFNDFISGNILVASYRSTTFLSNISLDRDTILIVGDRHSILEYAVFSKVKMIIIVGDGELKEEHYRIAKENGVNIIKTHFDTFHTARTVNLSNYVEDITLCDGIIKFDETDYLSDFIEHNRQSKHTNYPIVNKKGTCIGFLRLVDINDKNKKQVILVDHNEPEQSVDGIEEADILEVIDHHRMNFKTSMPISFRNMPVGSTNTIIFGMYEENNIDIPQDIAGIMLSGIISDTLLLKSPTTTQLDRYAVSKLSEYANIEYEKYGVEMFKAGSSIKGKTLEEVLFSDFKVFKFGNTDAGIGQIFTTDYSGLKLDVNKMVEVLNQVSINNDYSIVALFITDVMTNGSYLLFNDKSKEILRDAFDLASISEEIYLKDVISRKKQIIPAIIDVLERN